MNTKTIRRATTLLTALLILSAGASAQDADLRLHFDFSQASGTTVTDGASGVVARIVSPAKAERMGAYGVLSLGNGTGYLDMTQAAGQQVRSLTDFTVSVYYRVDEDASLSGAGRFLWSFSQSAANTQTEAPYTAYRLNAQRMATSTGGWGGETGMEMGTESAKGAWVHVLYRQAGRMGELFIDGQRVRQSAVMPVLQSTFTAVPAYCWIGRAPFAADSYLQQTLVADFRLYGVAVTDDVVAALAAQRAALDHAYLHGGGGDNGSLLGAIDEAHQLMALADDCPAGAVAMLRDAIAIAEGMAEADLTQMAYDRSEADLREAMTVFKNARGTVFDTTGITDVYDTDRGFRHPGGLHTQADFDRIRRQLAEGNATVTAAYNVLRNAEYAQPGVATWPVETIVRGGTSGQNYINAARGATMAYQNALRWKIEDNRQCAAGAVRILMQWARTCRLVSGDSNWALAAGLYGYEFAQAAELVRDYDGWAAEDFEEFKRWMLTVWYPGNINFLRGRNGTWENWVGGQGGIRPGHYWSNWPLCNALAVISIGILCDDVFIYNQGMSFMKYDQVGTFKEQRPADLIVNDGCTEFMGNLVVTTSQSALETGAYGRLGQMQESGRDGGHAAMALGLAVDICKVAWNQGDDLFSYMDNRMAAGIEFVAACTQNVQGLPWTNYKYVDCRTAWHNGWLMTGPAEPAETRPYWGTVIGHYEGVKGVRMPFSERAYATMTAGGPDGGGAGSVSGGYDHLGYSVLMNTHDTQLCPENQRPTLLTPRMEYGGRTLMHNELGGLDNTYVVRSTGCLPAGETVRLMPQLPEGEEDTGLWRWNTGQTTRDITVGTDRSYVYRATYTNRNGVESHQAFTIAAEGDCTPSPTNQGIYVDGVRVGDTTATVFYGDKVTLSAGDAAGWNPTVLWDNGTTGTQTSAGAIASERTAQAVVVSQGGRRELVDFHIGVRYMQPRMVHNGTTLDNQTRLMAEAGDRVVLVPYVPAKVANVGYVWSDHSTGASLDLGAVGTSGVYTVVVSIGGHEERVTFEVFLKDPDTRRAVEPGNYLVRHALTDTYMTNKGEGASVAFEPLTSRDHPDSNQVWTIDHSTALRYSFKSLADDMGLAVGANTTYVAVKAFNLTGALGLERYAMSTGTAAAPKFWNVDADGNVMTSAATTLDDYPFELVPYSPATGIIDIDAGTEPGRDGTFDLLGRRTVASPASGIYIRKGKKYVSEQ